MAAALTGLIATVTSVVSIVERGVVDVSAGWRPEKNGCTTSGTTKAPREKLK